jgi:sulfite exporter TauE/SafE
MEFTIISAFLTGLLGSLHCVGMCGGVVSALSFGIDKQATQATRFSMLLSYNVGRISSYVVAGALLGGLSALLVSQSSFEQFRQILKIISALFLIVLGLYLSDWWTGLSKVEKLGVHLWKRISPIANKFIPIKTNHHGFILGLFWGWLPCGMVYSLLVGALSSGSASQGGLIMLSFGIGTLPSMLLVGIFATRFNDWIKKSIIRQLAGGMVVLFGVFLFYQAIISTA